MTMFTRMVLFCPESDVPSTRRVQRVMNALKQFFACDVANEEFLLRGGFAGNERDL